MLPQRGERLGLVHAFSAREQYPSYRPWYDKPRNPGDSIRNSRTWRLCQLSTRLRTPGGKARVSACGRSATIGRTLRPMNPRRGGQRPKAVRQG